MYIYKTTNLITKKIYVGKSTQKFGKYLGSGKILLQSIKKYGKENFIVEKLEDCKTNVELNEREKYWIKTLNSQDNNIGYNIADGGEGGVHRKGKKHTEETKIKMKSYKTPEWLNKMSELRKGITFSDEHKNNLKLAWENRKWTDDAIKKSAQTRKGKKRGPYKISEESRKIKSEKARERMLGKKRGPFSDEHRLKLSESAKKRKKKTT